MQALLDISQAAEYLNLQPRTLREWVRREYIPYVRLGPGAQGTLRFRKDSLDRWIERQEKGPAL